MCQTHNSALSPADDAALKIASFLRRIALEYDAGAGEWGAAEEVTISGDDMQRWVLKLFLNHAVTGHFDVQQHHDVSFPPEAIDLLLDRAAWPSTWGLTVPGDPNNKDVRYTEALRADRAVVLNGPWKWQVDHRIPGAAAPHRRWLRNSALRDDSRNWGVERWLTDLRSCPWPKVLFVDDAQDLSPDTVRELAERADAARASSSQELIT